MLVYCTSKNTGPSWSIDPTHMLYLGTSFEEAEKAVGDFVQYRKEEKIFYHLNRIPELYSALPKNIEWRMVRWYTADGYWYSIVQFYLDSP